MNRDPPVASAEIELLSRIAATLERIEARLPATQQPDPVLNAIRKFAGCMAFTTVELFDMMDPELAAMLEGFDAKSLGLYLAGLQGRGVIKLRRDSDGIVWRLV
jgi:hypothetical protein